MSLGAEPSIVEVFVGPDAIKIDVWDRYTFDLSMLDVGLAWTLSCWYSDEARASWRLLTDPNRGVKCGELVTVAIDGDAVLSGLVETRAVGDDEGQAPVFVISGRDVLGAAASWDADPTLTLKGRALEDALTAVYGGVGVVPEVSQHVDPTAHVGRLRTPRRHVRSRAARRRDVVRASHPRVGEKVQQVAERMVRQLGYRLWTAAAEGRTAVVVDRPASSGAPLFTLLRELVNGRVTEASNLLAGKEVTSIKEVPSVVTAFADAPRGDSTSAKISREVANGFLLTDAAAARVSLDAPPRPRYLQSRSATTEAGAHNEASRVCAQANERFRVVEYSVPGHRQGGRLWVPNTRVAVRDELVGIDETMLCVSVRYAGSRTDAQRTQVTLVPEGALSEIPEVDS